jgi:uncharacterized protein YdaU (DUF1376 family)
MNYDLFTDGADGAQVGDGLMAAIPFMPLYVSDYLADAAHLSTLEHGAYLLLIMTYWQRAEPLPDNDRKLARIARLSDAEWAEMREDIAEFFTVEDGLWKHGRIDHEIEKAKAKLEAARNAGRASAQRRLNDRSTRAQRKSNYIEGDKNNNTIVSNDTIGEVAKDGEDENPVDESLKPEHVVEKWNETAEMISRPKVRDLTPERRALVKARIAQYSIDDFVTVFAKIAGSPFLRGDTRWKGATFDWTMKKANFQKIIEGNYDD